ncbi:MAG: hypothetical protein QNJ14_09580 [Woeseiaceae bacterium]|nr:hypothetical protein [Woeseiaceae bacterium]
MQKMVVALFRRGARYPTYRQALCWTIPIAWLAGVIALGKTNFFFGPSPLPVSRLQTAIILPMLLFWLFYFRVARFRHFVLSLDLTVVNALQCWRVAGIAILLVWAFGLLPGGFAVPMSILDASVGVLAILTVSWTIDRQPGWRGRVLAINVWGFLDFFITIALALFAGSLAIDPPVAASGYADLRALPLCVFPGFAIPFFSCLHFVVFAQLYRLSKGDSGNQSND